MYFAWVRGKPRGKLPETHTSYAIQLQLKVLLKQLNKLDGSSRLPCALSNSGWASLSTHEQVAGYMYLTSNLSHSFVAVSLFAQSKSGQAQSRLARLRELD